MLASLAFLPENEVIPCFNRLMLEFPSSAIEIADYFEKRNSAPESYTKSTSIPNSNLETIHSCKFTNG